MGFIIIFWQQNPRNYDLMRQFMKRMVSLVQIDDAPTTGVSKYSSNITSMHVVELHSNN